MDDQNKLLPLAVNERFVEFQLGTAKLRHVFTPPATEAVKTFFRAKQHQLFEASEGTLKDEPADLSLWRTLIRRVEGYVTSDGRAIGDALANWQERIPPAHKLRAIEWLAQAAPAPSEKAVFEVDAEFDVARLAGLWNGVQYDGLVHYFEPFTPEDRHGFRRDCSKGIAVGGSRKGVTLFPSANNILLRIYDTKIRAVAGYAVHNVALGKDVENIRSAMCPFHKASAILPFFHEQILATASAEGGEAAEIEALAEAQRIEDGSAPLTGQGARE